MKRYLMFLPLAVVLAACAHTEDPDDGAAEPDLATPTTLAGVDNFAKVTDGVWRGGQPSAEGMRTLKSMGVKTIVNLRAISSDRTELRGTELNYVHIRTSAAFLSDDEVAKALRIATDSAHRPVFIHCEHGADRTGAVIAAYRMVVQGWDSRKARREVGRFGFHKVWQNLDFYLDRFDAEKVRTLMGQVEVEVEYVP